MNQEESKGLLPKRIVVFFLGGVDDREILVYIWSEDGDEPKSGGGGGGKWRRRWMMRWWRSLGEKGGLNIGRRW